MKMMNVSEAKAHFSSAVEAVQNGETLLICKRNVPVAQITAMPPKASEKRHHTKIGWASDSSIRIIGDLTEPAIPTDEWDMLT